MHGNNPGVQIESRLTGGLRVCFEKLSELISGLSRWFVVSGLKSFGSLVKVSSRSLNFRSFSIFWAVAHQSSTFSPGREP
jgi:hypothetical protein